MAKNSEDPVHEWFSLSYASHLVVPRSVLQSMPTEWQAKMVALLDEMRDTCRKHGVDWGSSRVSMLDDHGRIVKDHLADYERGRRRLWPKEVDNG